MVPVEAVLIPYREFVGKITTWWNRELRLSNEHADNSVGSDAACPMMKIEAYLCNSRNTIHLGRPTMKKAWCILH